MCACLCTCSTGNGHLVSVVLLLTREYIGSIQSDIKETTWKQRDNTGIVLGDGGKEARMKRGDVIKLRQQPMALAGRNPVPHCRCSLIILNLT